MSEPEERARAALAQAGNLGLSPGRFVDTFILSGGDRGGKVALNLSPEFQVQNPQRVGLRHYRAKLPEKLAW